MKNINIFILFIFFQSYALFCQQFYYYQTNGEMPSGYDLNKVNDSNNIKKVLLTKNNDVLSKTQSFPFPFKFQGHFFTNYKASDNGYITFNTDNTISYKPDSNFSNQSVLKNAIFPFWYDFELKKLPYPNTNFNVKIFAYTAGKFPNRIHVIQYYGLSKTTDTLSATITNANVFAFAIILHEGNEGRFDFVFNFFGKNNIKGLIGCSDNFNNFTLLKNKPLSYPVSVSSAVNTTLFFQFVPGIAPTKRLYLKHNVLETQYKINEPVTIKSTISNIGSDTLYKFKYCYIVNSKDTVVKTIDLKTSNQYLLPKGENTLEINALKLWETGAGGSINIIKTLALLDTDSLNKDTIANSKTSSVLRILGLRPIARNVLMEISTGGWCGYCTNSHLVAENLKAEQGSRFIPVMHHFGDPMETTESNKINEAYEKGYPYGIIDRKYFSGQSNGWKNIVDNEKTDSSAVKIKIVNKNYDETTRKITFTLNVKFFDYLLGQFRIGAIITENNIRGNASPSQWSQNNYYSKQYGASDTTNPLYNEWRYMDGYLHQYVVLDFPYGAWGKEKSLPDTLKPNDEFNFDISFILPATTVIDYSIENNTKYCNTMDGEGQNEGMYKPKDIELIGFVADYNEDIYKRTILNAVSNALLYDPTNIKTDKDQHALRIYPNPASEFLTIVNPFHQPTNFIIEIYNLLGNCVIHQENNTIDHPINIDLTNLKTGIYFIKIQDNNRSFVQKINVVK